MKSKDTKITVLILISTVISVLVCLCHWVDKKQTKKEVRPISIMFSEFYFYLIALLHLIK